MSSQSTYIKLLLCEDFHSILAESDYSFFEFMFLTLCHSSDVDPRLFCFIDICIGISIM